MPDIHVVPMNDWMEHLELRQCVCRPDVDESAPVAVVIHHAFDSREYAETCGHPE